MPAQNQLFTIPPDGALPTDPHLLLGDAQLAATLYGQIGAKAGEEGTAKALGIESTGQLSEAEQYDVSAGIASNNSQLALVGGDIQKYQAMRNVQKTIGTQQSVSAAGGFANAGSALDVARSSLQQGLLQTQLIGTNADLTAGGYLEQASAAQAQATTARTASSYTAAMAASATAQANIAGNAINAQQSLMAGLPGGSAILNAVNTGNFSGLDPNSVMGANGMYNPQAIMAHILNNTPIAIPGMPNSAPTPSPGSAPVSSAGPASMSQG